MLRVDEQEGSRAWCRDREWEGEKKRVNRATAGLSGRQRHTEMEAAKQTPPSVCQEDICAIGLCVTVSDGPRQPRE